MIQAIDGARKRHKFDLWAWVIMPEHVHMLIFPTSAPYSVSKILASIKLPVTIRALKYVKRKAPGFLARMEDLQPNGKKSYRFWQRGGGYDGNLTEPKTIWTMIEYIHANPVRRNLCDGILDYKWSSAEEYESPGTGMLTIDRESLPSWG